MMTSDDVINFWFGDGSHEATRRWFSRDPAFDAEVRTKFSALHAEASGGALDPWGATVRGALALIVLFDQFSRNMFRDDPRAFATDAPAVAITRELIASGRLGQLPIVQRSVALMPLMHSEERADQRESLVQFGKLAEEDPTYKSSLDYAQRHAAIVERFGRFPHRNAVLGRASTAEELAFLEQPGSRF
jgi:uncharacterized protein (DUF924 family)